jgi:hypothetical protein
MLLQRACGRRLVKDQYKPRISQRQIGAIRSHFKRRGEWEARWYRLEHFQEKWKPVSVRKCDKRKKLEHIQFPEQLNML